MKYIIFVLTLIISVSGFAQDDILVKTDGTKYYLQIYDGDTNEKVLQYVNASGWQYKIFTGDFFDGSDKQLWSFEATEMFPGYFSIVNYAEEVGPTFHLMSYNWLAYFSDADNRDPKTDKEMQFKFVKVTDEYYKLITIEKPTDGSLYGINYTPGADALNVDANGQADFGDVKSDDITPDNMVNMVFKVVEFNPMALFEESIVRGDELYNSNPDAPEKARYDLFYTLEKAREIRVFGTEGEMLAYQPNIDAAVVDFNQSLGLLTVVNEARAFIDTTNVNDEVKTSFNAIVDEAEQFLISEDLVYDEIDAVVAKVEEAQRVVEAILAAQIYSENLQEQDSSLMSGVDVSIANAEMVLANDTSNVAEYGLAISHLNKTQAIIDEIIIANELIAATQEFEEAKVELTDAVEVATGIINTAGTSVEELDMALLEMQNAIKAFKRALEAGDTSIELKNADFEADLADWNVDSPTPGAAYPENKGVDGSRSITFWKGADYQMKVSQTISNVPNGTYIVSCFAKVSVDNSIALFTESGENSTVLPLATEGGLIKRTIEAEVTNGMLQFGIKGTGADNTIPAGNWIVFDAFEVKWSSKLAINNAGFEDGLTDWHVEGVTAAAYPENKGVDGSGSITCWSGSDYEISVSQTLSGLANGIYAVSAMAKTNQDSAFVIFGESAGVVMTEPVAGAQLVKIKSIVAVTDGTLKFGVKGAGEGNIVPAGRWIVFDNVEVVRMPDVPIVNPGFEEDFTGWFKESPADWMPYIENKGIDGSKSVTYWMGSDYTATTNQTISNLHNGVYEVSVMTNASADNIFSVFGSSAGNDFLAPLLQTGALAKHKVLAEVTDEALNLGIKTSGENGMAPGGSWIVFDNFEVKLKSITPVYETPEPTPTQMLLTDINTQKLDNEIKYWQSNQRLNIQSNDAIVKYSVYSITGAMVDMKETRSNTVTIPMRRGIFIVRVLTENGVVDTEKVSIR